MPESIVPDGRSEDMKRRAAPGSEHYASTTILQFPRENKTRTKKPSDEEEGLRGRPIAGELSIHRTWRQVVDFGDPKSSGIGDAWGYKSISVPWVSILDAPTSDADPPSR